MLIVKISIMTAGALLLLAPTITPSSLNRIRRGDDCYKKTVHLAFEKAEKTCFDETVTEKTPELVSKHDNTAEVEERFRDLLDYYHIDRGHNTVVQPSLKDKFEKCYLREAVNGLSMKQDVFNKKYDSGNVLGILEKVNNPYCKAKYAEINVLDDNFIKEKREQWSKLGVFRRAIKTAMGNLVALMNPKIGECLGNMDKVTLPQLLCAVQGGEALILEKKQCYEELMKLNAAAAKKTTSTTTDNKPLKTLIRLGFFSKFVTDHIICANIDKQHNVKQNLKGAGKILATWPFGIIVGVIAIPVAAIIYFFVWCCANFLDNNWFFSCLGGVGAAGGAVLGLCLLLYSVFGIPWKALSRIFSYDENSNKVDFEEEFKEADWFYEAFGELYKNGFPKSNN